MRGRRSSPVRSESIGDVVVPRAVSRRSTRRVGYRGIRAVLEQQLDDLELLAARSGGSARAGGLHREVQSGRASVLQNGIGSSAERKELADGGHAAGAHRSMQSGGSSAIGVGGVGAALDEQADEGSL